MDSISTLTAKNELISVDYTTGDAPVVSARELHKRLGVTERFQSWFNRQLKYGFKEGINYTTCIGYNEKARQNLADYNMSISMALQLLMTQSGEKSQKYREYLVKVQEEWNSPAQVMARAMKLAQSQISQMQMLIEANAEKVAFAEAVEETEDDYSIADAAKIITSSVKKRNKDFRMGQKKLFKWMRENGILSDSGNNKNKPLQSYIDSGMMKMVIKKMVAKGETVVITTPRITGKGLIYITNKILRESG